MNRDSITKYWIESSNSDYLTMKNLFSSKDYSWSLFIGHLVIEKLLKALYVKNVSENVPFIHDLLRLASKTGVTIDEMTMDKLDEITSFNIKSRYDNYKRSFYKLCTYDFAKEKIIVIEEVRTWLLEILKK